MILIADSGSTKTDWAVLGGGALQRTFRTSGYNPNYLTADEILDDMADTFPEDLDPMGVTEIYFYGAGINEVTSGVLLGVLHEAFPNAYRMTVESDLLGTARALLGHGEGFAAILGTGMNSCLFDGEKIVSNVGSLGFFLGDEGSAGYIGKTLLRDYLRGNVPQEVADAMSDALEGKAYPQVIAELYSALKPNTYCAEFCRIATGMKDSSEYCRNLVADSFRAFFRNVICLYPDYSRYTLNCIGSVGCICKDILSEVAAEFGMSLGTVLQAPMEGLVQYHLGSRG